MKVSSVKIGVESPPSLAALIESARTPYANVPGFEYLCLPVIRKSRRIVLRCLIVDFSIQP